MWKTVEKVIYALVFKTKSSAEGEVRVRLGIWGECWVYEGEDQQKI